MTDEVLRTHYHFKMPISLLLYMTPTRYKIRFPQDLNFDHYVAYGSKNLEQLYCWQKNASASFNSNVSFSSQPDLFLTPTPMMLQLLFLLKNFTTKPINFFLNKNTRNTSSFKTINSLQLSHIILTTL